MSCAIYCPYVKIDQWNKGREREKKGKGTERDRRSQGKETKGKERESTWTGEGKEWKVKRRKRKVDEQQVNTKVL